MAGHVQFAEAATHRRVFCLDFFVMFRPFGECLFFGIFKLSLECYDFSGMLRLTTDLIDLKKSTKMKNNHKTKMNRTHTHTQKNT